MARGDELRVEVGAAVSDPPSLVKYFTKLAELEQWVAGDEAKRGRLEKRWRRRYADHVKKTRAAAREKAAR